MQRLVAGILVVGLAIVERMLRQLQMWRKPTVHEHGAADAGSQGQDDLQSAAGKDAQALYLGIVEQARWALQTLCHSLFQRVSAPGFIAEVRRGHDAAAAHHTWKSNRDPLKAREWGRKLYKRAQ